jgi:hypothetical protein
LELNEFKGKTQSSLFHILRLQDLDSLLSITSREPHRTNFFGMVLFEQWKGQMKINDTESDYPSGLVAFTKL